MLFGSGECKYEHLLGGSLLTRSQLASPHCYRRFAPVRLSCPADWVSPFLGPLLGEDYQVGKNDVLNAVKATQNLGAPVGITISGDTEVSMLVRSDWLFCRYAMHRVTVL